MNDIYVSPEASVFKFTAAKSYMQIVVPSDGGSGGVEGSDFEEVQG